MTDKLRPLMHFIGDEEMIAVSMAISAAHSTVQPTPSDALLAAPTNKYTSLMLWATKHSNTRTLSLAVQAAAAAIFRKRLIEEIRSYAVQPSTRAI